MSVRVLYHTAQLAVGWLQQLHTKLACRLQQLLKIRNRFFIKVTNSYTQILWQLNSWSDKCKNHVRSMIKVWTMFPRFPLNNFSCESVPLSSCWGLLGLVSCMISPKFENKCIEKSLSDGGVLHNKIKSPIKHSCTEFASLTFSVSCCAYIIQYLYEYVHCTVCVQHV